MSSSRDIAQKRRIFHRRTNQSVPFEIDLDERKHINESLEEDAKRQPSSDWSTPLRRIHVISGHANLSFGEPWMHPPEPEEAPPTPTEIVRILVLGDRNSGKTSIVRSFVYREGLSHEKKFTKSLHWSLDYHKKDVTFWHTDTDEIGSARLQIWDVTGVPDQQLEFETLLDKANLILCVVSLEQGRSQSIRSIKFWKKQLHHLSNVTVLLHKSDLLPSHGVMATDWIHFGSQVGELLSGCEFYMTSCANNENNSIQNAIMKEVRRISRSTVCLSEIPNTTTSTPLIEAKAIPIYSLRQLNL